MPFRPRRRGRPLTVGHVLPRLSHKTVVRFRIALVIAVVIALLLTASLYLRQISCEMALSDAQDIVVFAINEAINKVMTENDFPSDYFVKLEKDSQGNVTAITTNMTHINSLSTTILGEVVEAADSGRLDIRIPLGNLLGSNLMLGRGPDIPVEIIMLTSSFVDYGNEFVSTGINQSKHRLVLQVNVDIDILIPWATLNTRVETDVILAETVVVGQVPETYVNMQK
ncbi:MAG: sporulation protein YunB [Oscillospiraceae bacterium]